MDAFTPSGDLLGVFHDRIEAVQAVLMQGVQAELRQCGQPFSAASINSMLS